MSSPTALRPRFTLLTLLLVMTIVALSFGLYRSHSNQQRAEHMYNEASAILNLVERDVAGLKTRLAQQSGADFANLRAETIQYPLSAERPLRWSWWVSVPQGHRYQLHLATGKDVQGMQPNSRPLKKSTSAPLSLDPGEHEINLFAFRHSATGRWVVRLAKENGPTAWEGEPLVPWGEYRLFTNKSDRNGDPTLPFVVGHCEVHGNSGLIDGALIWLEPLNPN